MSNFECRDLKKFEFQDFPGKNSGTRFPRVSELMEIANSTDPKIQQGLDIVRKELGEGPLAIDVMRRMQAQHDLRATIQAAVQKRRIDTAMARQS